MWDMYGLECLLDVGKLKAEHEAWEKKTLWAILKEEQSKDIEPKIPLQYMIMRAKVNSQRCYEIYEFTSTLSYDDVKLSFEIQPQDVVDFIRKHGYKVYSDRSEKKQVIA
jgi:hypothetical protein